MASDELPKPPGQLKIPAVTGIDWQGLKHDELPDFDDCLKNVRSCFGQIHWSGLNFG